MTSRKRLKALVHYMCDRCGDPTKLGATKLNKALWYADTFAYRLLGRTISGEQGYIKRQFGPVPRRILEALRALEAEGAIRVRESDYFGKPKREFISLEPADDSLFSDDELDIVNQVIRVVCDEHTATSISDLSHDIIWAAAGMGEEIPIFAVLAAKAAPATKADMAWANDIIKRQHSAKQ